MAQSVLYTEIIFTAPTNACLTKGGMRSGASFCPHPNVPFSTRRVTAAHTFHSQEKRCGSSPHNRSPGGKSLLLGRPQPCNKAKEEAITPGHLSARHNAAAARLPHSMLPLSPLHARGVDPGKKKNTPGVKQWLENGAEMGEREGWSLWCWERSLWDDVSKGRNTLGGNQDGEGCRRDGETLGLKAAIGAPGGGKEAPTSLQGNSFSMTVVKRTS